MERGWPIRWLLFAIVGATAVPLCAYIGAVLVRESQDAQEHAEQLALSVASAAAARTAGQLRTIEHVARAIAQRPLVRALDPSACDPLLAGVLPLFPQFANISVVDREQRFVCSALALSDGTPTLPPHGGVVAALAGRFALSEPLMGVLPAALVVSAGHPVRDTSGTVVGALTIPIPLSALDPIRDPGVLPRGARVRVIDGAGILLASSTRNDPDLGKNLRGTEGVETALARANGSAWGRAPGGAEHLFAFARIDGNDWRALAELPVAPLLAQANARTVLSVLLAGITLGTALLAASLIARHISRPLRALERAIDAAGAGHYAQAAEDGPREVQNLARNFNAMVGERMSADEKLRGLSMRLMEVEENERRHISGELHDRIGGNLAALDIGLGLAAEKVDQRDLAAAAPLLADAREVVSATSAEIRTLMAELRPAALDDFGLATALRTYATAVAARIGVALGFAMNDVPRTRPTVETALYRIAQEALTNIAKHARAKNVRIELAERDGILTLAVEDDGVGFDASGWRGEGLGLRNMRERADAVGARVKVSSAPGAGTRVVAEVKV